MVYDIAHRIGAYLGKIPTLVYLHRGTKEGAAVLGFRGVTIDPAVLPSAFSGLTPAEIEDCLAYIRTSFEARLAVPVAIPAAVLQGGNDVV